MANQLVLLGHSLTCYSFSPAPKDSLYEHVPLGQWPKTKIGAKFKPAISFASVPTSSFDIVHYHGDDYLCHGSYNRIRTFYGSAICEAMTARRVSWFCYQFLFYVFEIISCIRQGEKVAISNSTRKFLPCINKIIPCGVPLNKFTYKGQQKTPYPSILFVGTFKGRKNGDYLLSVFLQYIVPQFPTARLVVVGPQKLNAPNLECMGIVDESTLISLYQRSWIYCMVSSYEGFGVPVIEAMACSAAVIAIDNCSIRDIVTDKVNGIICTKEDFPKNLVQLIRNNSMRMAICSSALKSLRRFDIETVATEYLSVYEQCLRRSRKSKKQDRDIV